jgi:hypothetical protein
MKLLMYWYQIKLNFNKSTQQHFMEQCCENRYTLALLSAQCSVLLLSQMLLDKDIE